MPIESVQLTIRDREITIQEPMALASIKAIGLLAKYVKPLAPFFRDLRTRQPAEGQDLDTALQLIAELQPLIVDSPHDIFIVVSLLTGLEPGWLEELRITEFAGIVAALLKVNNLAGLVTAALSI